MKILLTGANGYIGKRLLPLLIERGCEVVCAVRDKARFPKEGITLTRSCPYARSTSSASFAPAGADDIDAHIT